VDENAVGKEFVCILNQQTVNGPLSALSRPALFFAAMYSGWRLIQSLMAASFTAEPAIDVISIEGLVASTAL
jgi:hypothetical protein